MSSQSVSEILPGVWKLHLGSPETLTPSKFRSAPIAKAGFAGLPEVYNPFTGNANIFSKKTPRGYTIEIPIQDGEQFYGLGLSTRTFNLNGRKAWTVPSDHPEEETNESHGPDPFFVSSRGYGVYVDTARYASFSFGDTRRVDGHPSVVIDIPAASGADLYVFGGPTALQAVQRYNLFSGGGPIPPLWGLGIAYRGKGDFTANDFLNLAKSFRETKMPCDIIGIEPGWQTQTYSSSFVWNKQHFPDPDGFIRSIHGMDFKLSFWEHPFTHPTSPMYEALKPYSGDYKVWGGLVPDFATAGGRKAYVGQQKVALLSKGVDSFKIDEVDSQPFKSDPWSFPDFSEFPSGLDGEQMHSMFGTLAQQALWGPFESSRRRTWGLVRESGAMAAPLPYTLYSDTYDHRCYVRGMAKMGFGGHLWVPEVRDAKTVADLIRRVQTVIFSPYAMLNCWYMRTPPWLQIDTDKSNAGVLMPEAKETTDRVRKLFQLRYSLIPYLYSSFNEYRSTGLPPVRAILLDFPSDAEALKVDDEFMFGPSLLVAPFIDGVGERSVYLPSGVWYDFFTNERIAGGRRIDVHKSLDEMPLYVREGALLPLAAPVQHVSSSMKFDITVRAYGDHPADFTLYEDDGESLDYMSGNQTRVKLSFASRSVSRSGGPTPERYRVTAWQEIH